MLPKQTIDLPFIGALDESIATQLLPPGQFATYENVISYKRGSIRMRPAFRNLGEDPYSVLPKRIVSHEGQLLGMSRDADEPALYRWHANTWRRVGFLPPCTNERIPRLRRGQASVTDADFCAGVSYDVLAYRDTTAASTARLHLVIWHRDTGHVETDYLLANSGDASNVRCTKAAIGDYALVTWHDRGTGTLYYCRVNTATGSYTSRLTLVSDAIVRTQVSDWQHDISPVPGSSDYVFAYCPNTGPFVRVRRISSNVTTIATYTSTGSDPVTSANWGTALAVGTTGLVYLTARDTLGPFWAVLDVNLGVDLPWTFMSMNYVYGAAAVAYVGEETCLVLIGRRWLSADRYGNFGTVYQMSDEGGPISKPWAREYNGRAMIYVRRNDTHHLVELQTQPNYDESAMRPITNCAYQTAAEADAQAYKLNTVTPTADGAACILPVHFLVRTSSTGDVTNLDEDTQIGFDELRITYGDPLTGQTAVLDGVLHLSGGLLCEYDGRDVYENGFVDEPRAKWLVNHATGTTIVQGASHGAVAVWDWWDAKGRRHQSHPSFPSIVTAPAQTLDALSYSGPGSPPSLTYAINTPTIAMSLKIQTADAGALGTGTVVYSFDNGSTWSEPVKTSNSLDLYEYREGDQYTTGAFVGVRLTFGTGTLAVGSVWTANQGVGSKYGLRVDYDQMTLRRNGSGAILCSPYYTGPNGRIYYRMFPFEDYPTATAYNTADASISTGLLNVLQSEHWALQLRTIWSAAVTHQQMLYSAPDGAGELPNDPIHGGCVHLVTHGDRMFASSAEHPTRLRYSKPSVPGVPVSFPEGFEIDLGERITGLASIAGVLVVFSATSTYLIHGDGPDATGGGGSFSLPQRLPTEHGCIDARSIAVFEGGVLFRSSRGIMLLDRRFGVQFVGAPVLERLDSTIEILGAHVLPTLQQVRFLTTRSTARWLVFDFSDEIPRWFAWNHASSIVPVASGMHDGLHHFVADDASVWREESSYAYDNNDVSLWATPRIQTGWIHLGKLANFKRLWRAALTVTDNNPHGITISYETSEDDSESVSWSSDDLALAVNSETLVPLVCHLRYQQARAWKFTITAQAPTESAATSPPVFTWHGLSLQIGIKEQVRKGRA